MQKQTITITTLDELDQAAQTLANAIPQGSWVYLQGTLGAGKTTFSQRFIKHKGCDERVTSPTYALMQDYHTHSGTVIHCDLYRLADPEELYEIGLTDMAIQENAITLVEWADKGRGVLPQPDFTIAIDIVDNQTQARAIHITEHERG